MSGDNDEMSLNNKGNTNKMIDKTDEGIETSYPTATKLHAQMKEVVSDMSSAVSKWFKHKERRNTKRKQIKAVATVAAEAAMLCSAQSLTPKAAARAQAKQNVQCHKKMDNIVKQRLSSFMDESCDGEKSHKKTNESNSNRMRNTKKTKANKKQMFQNMSQAFSKLFKPSIEKNDDSVVTIAANLIATILPIDQSTAGKSDVSIQTETMQAVSGSIHDMLDKVLVELTCDDKMGGDSATVSVTRRNCLLRAPQNPIC